MNSCNIVFIHLIFNSPKYKLTIRSPRETVDMAEPERCPQDVFEILFASDVHLGFGCKDPVRGQDSQRTFEEILRVGRERGVDFVLLGGDLFHQSTPPKNVMDGAIRALRKYCLGDKKTSFDLSSELKGSCSSLNFKDQHLNVALPVFTIHGVHDDPAGERLAYFVDVLSLSVPVYLSFYKL